MAQSSDLLNFYLSPGIQCTKLHCFIDYTPRKYFNFFAQSVVDARREGDENPHSRVVSETMKLLSNRLHGYQFIEDPDTR